MKEQGKFDQKEYIKNYYKENREKLNEYHRLYNQKNKERLKELRRKRYLKKKALKDGKELIEEKPIEVKVERKIPTQPKEVVLKEVDEALERVKESVDVGVSELQKLFDDFYK